VELSAVFLLRSSRDLGLHRRVGHAWLALPLCGLQSGYAVLFKPLLPRRDVGRRSLQGAHDLTVGRPWASGKISRARKTSTGRQATRRRPPAQPLRVLRTVSTPIPSHDYQTELLPYVMLGQLTEAPFSYLVSI